MEIERYSIGGNSRLDFYIKTIEQKESTREKIQRIGKRIKRKIYSISGWVINVMVNLIYSIVMAAAIAIALRPSESIALIKQLMEYLGY